MSFIRDQIMSVVGGKPVERLVFVRRIFVRVTGSVAANLPAGGTTVLSFLIDPRLPAVSTYTIPRGQKWRLVDLFIAASGDAPINGEVRLKKNFYTDNVVVGNLAQLLVSNPSRPMPAPGDWDEMETLSGEFINYTANGASAQTVTFTAVFDIYTKA